MSLIHSLHFVISMPLQVLQHRSPELAKAKHGAWQGMVRGMARLDGY